MASIPSNGFLKVLDKNNSPGPLFPFLWEYKELGFVSLDNEN